MQIATGITVHCGDILDSDCDVIALKHAQDFYGADAAVVRRLRDFGVEPNTLCPANGSYVVIHSKGAVQAKDILFVGLASITSFSYQDVRRLGATALRILKKERPRTTSLAMTIHGRGFGLDEIECVQQQLKGYTDSFVRGDFPESLARIVIVERDPTRAQVIEQVISEWSAASDDMGRDPVSATPANPSVSSYSFPPPSSRILTGTLDKPKIFVAMPFSRDMRDVWTFGIQQPVRNLGLLCERLDEESFIGDILTQITLRIEGASMVIADLTGANPNVFLEVGYAWGKGRPTILLFRQPTKGRNEQKLPFDVSGQRCIIYEDATHLHERLSSELVRLGFAEVVSGDR